jgi:hypothetical protein
MSEAKEYLYQNLIIILRYSPDNHYCDAGWYWEVFQNGESITDNSKSCPDYPLENALIFAKRAIDNRFDIDSDEMPILLLGES